MHLGTKYKKNWQSYRQLFTKNDTKLNLQDKPLITAVENWQVDSLNIEPQTFCGLIEIKETVTKLYSKKLNHWYH